MPPLQTHSGSPLPLGATVTPQGVNFALFSRHARAVVLVLELPGEGRPHEYLLSASRNATGDIWHILLPALPPGTRYGYRLSGPWDPAGEGHRFQEDLILLDPHARALVPSRWGERRDELGRRPCCLIDTTAFDWEGDRPLGIPLRDSIIYELHVRGFTRHESSDVRHPGTYLGLIEKIPYLRDLGVTAVELMPVTEFNENENIFRHPDTGELLLNFWGYSPLSFFAPKAGYAAGGDPLTEFRTMVKALHRAGIEVIVDIVFNHTAEGGADGPTTSLRGLDNGIYYLLDPATREYLNFSGCGNTCNCNHPIVRSLILDALRWWVVEMHVDGFRFDLASILGRDTSGHVLANPPVVERIAEEPVLANTKIIAEAWDASGLYQVGSFSPSRRWAEWNGRFRDDVRAFMRGEAGMVPRLATRIAGSSDLYQGSGRRPCNSVNLLTSHDGFTLRDLVSYEQKHNLENGEQNRDGDNHSLSWNSGVEGPADDAAVLALRERRIRTMAVLLLLSQGTPMLLAGDEFGRSQQGNNNAYCQDNEISWVDWRLAWKNKDLLRFFRRLIRLRRDHQIFHRRDFFSGGLPPDQREVIWQGPRPGEEDWSQEAHFLAFVLNGHGPVQRRDDDFFIMLNGHREDTVRCLVPPIPPNGPRRRWRRIIDTSAVPPYDFPSAGRGRVVAAGSALMIAPMGCMVLQSEPVS
ncbi:MAG: glycogen debranching enzyme GlgX [Desulfobulbaceae bacterium A2]|nr:MAG: glycogen debranching enzyme GlgX [Desulfobulbaceae bacterium A2]